MIGRFEEAILSALLAAKGEATTNDIFDALQGKYAPLSLGALFVVLDRMGKKELVSRRKGDPLPQRGGKARLYYKITTNGRAALIDAQQTTATLGSLTKPHFS
jgi:DNA-binding PadR family transcriptional regulator